MPRRKRLPERLSHRGRAGQVKYQFGSDRLNRASDRIQVGDVPVMNTDDPWRHGLTVVPEHTMHLVPGTDEFGDEMRAGKAGDAGGKNPHGARRYTAYKGCVNALAVIGGRNYAAC